MKISRARLEKIVREEFVKHVRSLMEAPTASVEDAESDNAEKEKVPDQKKADGGSKQPAGKKAPEKKLPQKDEPEEDEPADEKEPDGEGDHETDDLQQGHDSGEEEDADEVTGGEIAKEIAGKTVQSITMDPKSKIMPGAQEIVVTFDQIPDPLRILIGKTGTVRFYFRGLHNEL